MKKTDIDKMSNIYGGFDKRHAAGCALAFIGLAATCATITTPLSIYGALSLSYSITSVVTSC